MSSLLLDQNAFATGQWSPSWSQRSNFQILRDGQSEWQAVPSGDLVSKGDTSKYHRVMVHDPITGRRLTCLVPSGLQIFTAMKAEQNRNKHADPFYVHPTRDGWSMTGLDVAKTLYSNFTLPKEGTICSEIYVVPSSKQGSYRLRYTADLRPIFSTAIEFDSPVTGQPETRSVIEGAFPEPGLGSGYVHTGEKRIDGQLAWGRMPTQAGLVRMFHPYIPDQWSISQLVDDQSRWQPTFVNETAGIHSGQVIVGPHKYRMQTKVWFEGPDGLEDTADLEEGSEEARRNTALQLDIMPG